MIIILTSKFEIRRLTDKKIHKINKYIKENYPPYFFSITSLVVASDGARLRTTRLQALISNIKVRGVHRDKDGGFRIQFGNDKLKQITLNKSSAHAVSSLSEYFAYTDGVPFPDLLENVLPDTPYLVPPPDDLTNLMGLNSNVVSVRGIQELILLQLAKMYVLLRRDENVVKPGKDETIIIEEDFTWRLTGEDIADYVRSSDRFHRLMLFRHGNVFAMCYVISFT